MKRLSKKCNEDWVKVWCDYCGNPYEVYLNWFIKYIKGEKNYEHKFCSDGCMREFRMGGKWVECNCCKKWIYIKKSYILKSKRHFCSIECKNKGLIKDKIKDHCKECKKEISVYPSEIGENKFCNRRCYNFWYKREGFMRRWGSLRKTKPEKRLERILKEDRNLNKFEYVGNHQFWVGGIKKKNPDFVWRDRRKVIEVFGRYWHEEFPKCSRVKAEDEIKEACKTNGYECLIIWDDEMEKESDEGIRNRVSSFVETLN